MRDFGFFSLIALLLLAQYPYAQAQTPKADSLRTMLTLERDPMRQVDLMNDIAFALFDVDDSTAMVFAQRAVKTALNAGYKEGLKRALTYTGVGQVSRGNLQKAIQYYHYADTIKTQNQELTIYIHTMLGNAFRDLSRFDSAMYYQQLALDGARNYGKPRELAMVGKNMGMLLIHQYKPTEALDMLRMAQENLDKDYNTYLQAEIWSGIGKAYMGLLEYEQAHSYFIKMCSLVNALPDMFQKVKCHLNLTELALMQSDFSAALEEAFTAFDLIQRYAYPPQQAEVYQHIGEIYSQMSQFELAARYLYEALKIADRSSLQQRTGAVLAELAWVFKEMGNLPQAQEYINRSQQIYEAIGDNRGISACHNVRGLIFLLQKKFNDALSELEKARAMREQIGYLEGIAATVFNLALVYAETGQYQKALELQQQVIALEENLPNRYNLAISLNGIAQSLIRLKRYKEAWPYAIRANQLADSLQAKLLLKNTYATLADYYEGTGDFRRATEYLRRHQQLSDSIYTTSSRARLAELQTLYQLEQKEQQVKLLEQERQLRDRRMALQQLQLNNLRIVLAAGLLVLVLVSALTWSIYKANKDLRKAHREIKEQHEEIQAQAEELTEANRILNRLNRELAEKKEEIQAQAEELMEANLTINEINRGLESEVEKRTRELKQAYHELDTFFYRSSHDFRRPLTTFLGLAEVAKITVKDPNALELFARVRETALNLDKMLVKLQSISDVGVQEYDYREVRIKELFDSLCDNWREEINRKSILITSESHLTRPFISYPALIKIILENLLENAIHFSAPVNPRIHFSVHEAGDFVLLELADNGHGIPAELHDKVFDMYFRGSHYSKGNGLGLYIVKKAVEKLGGEIMFSSEVDKGTTFSVRISRNAHITSVV
ncbi:MAG: hypothetical protein KatS3mg032_0402 [Cyclobacteriaceae bacterium]|nr:MAG: hypothetical protein KatS3mg032_0402 [Cyclobacteriaceae bacterium]